MAELVEIRGVEIDGFRVATVEPDGDMRSVDCLDGAGGAVDDAGFLLGAGELYPVAGREFRPAVRGVELVIFAEFAALLPSNSLHDNAPTCCAVSEIGRAHV